MESFQTEEQQVEAIKKWWARNSKTTIGVLLVGLGIVLGGRVWVDYKNTQSEAASMIYESMMHAMEKNQMDAALEQGGRLLGQYENTPYATLAALASAKIKVDQGDTNAARTHLQWVLDHGKPEQTVYVARLRLARVLLDSGDGQQALTILGNEPPSGFEAAYRELQGDVYLSMSQVDNARTAYGKAIAALTPQARNRAELQMKLDNLGGSIAAAEQPQT